MKLTKTHLLWLRALQIFCVVGALLCLSIAIGLWGAEPQAVPAATAEQWATNAQAAASAGQAQAKATEEVTDWLSIAGRVGGGILAILAIVAKFSPHSNVLTSLLGAGVNLMAKLTTPAHQLADAARKESWAEAGKIMFNCIEELENDDDLRTLKTKLAGRWSGAAATIIHQSLVEARKNKTS